MPVALAGMVAVFGVITGVMVATCTGEPLLWLSAVTTAVSEPEVVGWVVNVTVSEVVVAEPTVPAAPSLNVTMSLAAVASKLVPVMVTVVTVAAWLVVVALT